MLSGPNVILGGQDFTVATTPGALLRLVDCVTEVQEAVTRGDAAAQINGMLKCASILLSVNYPGISVKLLTERATLPELTSMITIAVKAAMAPPATMDPVPGATFSHFVKPGKPEFGN